MPAMNAQVLRALLPIARLLLACFCGCAAVAAGSAIVEAAVPAPPFSPTADRFDQRTFVGRFAKMLTTCDPSSLLAGRAAVVQAAKQVAAFAKDGKATKKLSVPKYWSARLWRARKLAESAVNAGSGSRGP
jgi:hypothetical protein